MELVVLCGEKPTRSLLDRIHTNLPVQMAPEDKYEIKMVYEDACLIVATTNNPERRYRENESSETDPDPAKWKGSDPGSRSLFWTILKNVQKIDFFNCFELSKK